MNLFDIIITIVPFTITAIFYAFEQIHSHRQSWTWLPWWVVSGKNWFGLSEKSLFKNLDGFHMSLWLGRIMSGIDFIWIWETANGRVFDFLALSLLWWAYVGSLFSYMYHHTFMKNEYKGS